MRNIRVNINQRGIQELFDGIATKLEEADKSFRATHTGLPVDVVAADAADALPVSLNEEGLAAYAQAVSAGEPFQFTLR